MARPLPLYLAILPLALPATFVALHAQPAALPPAATKRIDFKADVYPILKTSCFSCHSGSAPASGYRLDQHGEILGSDNGEPLVVPGRSADSRLIQLVAGQVKGKVMPLKGERLTAEQIGILRAWIDQGAKWDEKLLPTESIAPKHWAFKPPQRPAVPKVRNAGWVKTPIDAFIAAAHETNGLKPAPEAPERTLIRRLYLDLLGFPPTPEEVEAFEKDTRADAYAKLVDRLLASPHYGERWGRHWLDLARWAESEGYESNHPRPYAWRYRDYVVASFNRDKPYDQFLREQLAGDELDSYSDEHLIATGFLAAARLSSNEEDKAIQRNDVLVDVANATSSVFLGLTMACAQCHSHKFDPLTHRDYYRFQGFFLKGQPGNFVLKDPALWQQYEAAKPAEFDPAKKLYEAIVEGTRARLISQARKDLPADALKALDTPPALRTPDQEKLARHADVKLQFSINRVEANLVADDKPLYTELKKKIEAMEKKMPDRPQTWAFYSPVTATAKIEHIPSKGFYPLPYDVKLMAEARPAVLRGGNVNDRGPVLDVGWPRLFGPTPSATVEKKPRLTLANWLARPEHPLTARVWVNRIWQYHFGKGLVATAGNFGTHGSKPTHPELLDWLATELTGNHWSTKHIHRQILLSSTYRQAALKDEANAKIDPDNKLLWRWQPRRLEAEAIRDSILFVAAELEHKLGGPSEPDEAKSNRRSLYTTQRRDQAPTSQQLFDGPNAATECLCKRHVSVTPVSALFLMNNPRYVALAEALARRVLKIEPKDPMRQAEIAMRIVIQRSPTAQEREAITRFYDKQEHGETKPGEPPLAFRHLCQVLLNLNEFLIIE
jgi:hypothetical protein